MRVKIKLCFFFLSLLIFSSSGFAQEQNYYQVLGLTERASPEEIKMAVRRMTNKYHPDKTLDEKKKELYHKKMLEILEARETLLNPLKRIEYDRELKSGNFYQKGAYQESSKKGQSQSGSETYADFSYRYSDINLKERPFFERRPPFPTSHIPQRERMLQLFHLILAHNMRLKESFQNSVSLDRKNVEKAKKQSHSALKEILRTMGIFNMKAQTFQRILNDFYHNFSEENLKEILKESEKTSFAGSQEKSSSESERQGLLETQRQNVALKTKAIHRRNVLAQAFLQFITEVKVWYEVQNIKTYERKAIEIFHTLSFLNQSPSELRQAEQRHTELLQKRGKKFPFRRAPLSKAERKELRFFEKQVAKDIRIFRNVLSALGLPKGIYNDMLLRSYLEGLKDSFVLNDRGGESSKKPSESKNSDFYLTQEKSGFKNLILHSTKGSGGGGF